ncbi:hypothetical protein N7G274_010752 [Stereocaulon virgatum]|uniref:RNA polymerase II subunit B1 CTD phosphatase RPAP2 homolog n=1 Tax=Stereocaulon virgatum TaxID=373712 RepID=A0ABR3ZSZ3_9LECA
MPQSILKKPSISITAISPPPVRSREGRNIETALYHAQLLQQRKDVEALILASTESLLDLPTSSTADPAHPSSADSILVRNSLRPFRPSDYDSLIEERNINKRCGYVLCPRPNSLQNTIAKYRILNGQGKRNDALRFVERQTLERWCSDDCGKRALHIKVQLSEEPAWTRTATDGAVVLLEDKHVIQRGADGKADLIEQMKILDIDPDGVQLAAQLKALAIERGDGIAPSRSCGLTETHIRERIKIDGPVLPLEPPIVDGRTHKLHGAIEGHQSQFSEKKLPGEDLEFDGEDVMETI